MPKMRAVFEKHDVNVINVSIRHAKPDPGTLLSWAPNETFAFVVYYKQGTSAPERRKVGVWTLTPRPSAKWGHSSFASKRGRASAAFADALEDPHIRRRLQA